VALARAADEELLMAQKTTKSQRSGGRRGQNASSRNGKGSAQSGGDKRPALEAMRQDTDADREYRQYVRREEQDRAGPPDVLLDVPELKVDLIHFELDDLDAHVAVKAQVLNLVKLTVGVDVHLSRVKLDIKGVEAELVMKAHLEHVAALVDRLMTSLDRNPELVDGLSRAVSEIGQGAGEAVDETGDAAKDVGKGAEGALKDVGKGAGQAVGDVGEGAGQAVGDIGQGAGQAVGDVGQGAGQAVGDVGQGAGQAAGNLDQLVGGVGQTVGQAGQGAGQALGGLGQGAGEGGQGGQALGGPGEGAGQALGQPGGNAQPQPDGQGQAGRPGAVAKQVAKMVAREIGHAASDEAKDLGLAATRKVRELGERREHRRAEKHNATEAAVRLADELGIDVADLEGTGSDGRVTVNDVRKAHEA
jgi:e3 binding domain